MLMHVDINPEYDKEQLRNKDTTENPKQQDL